MPVPEFDVQIAQSETVAEIVSAFHTEGCALIRNVLGREHVQLLKQVTDEYFENRESIDRRHSSYAGKAFVLRYCADLDERYRATLDIPAVQNLSAGILGKDYRFNAMNVIRNEPGTAISTWHVDDVLEFALPESIARFDARITMPVLWFTIQVALSDIDTLEHGPTQYVPGSHYSGRHPISQEDPAFEGVGPVQVLCKAGDIYLTNHQTWHRGAPNISDRTRYVMQLQFARRWADTRFRGLG